MSEQTSERIRLYRFMPSKWAMKSIETRELRVGRLAELNDPFEFVPGIEGLLDDAPTDVVRHQMWAVQTDLNSTMGLLSFSSTTREPTLWSHYADSHKGVALGLDVHRDPIVDVVTYQPNRPTIHAATPLDSPEWRSGFIRTITTKAPGWKAESEHRRLVRLAGCRCEAGDYFVAMTDKSLNEAFALAEVILGCRCQLEEDYVCQTLQQRGFTEVRVLRAKPSVDNTFQMICGKRELPVILPHELDREVMAVDNTARLPRLQSRRAPLPQRPGDETQQGKGEPGAGVGDSGAEAQV